MSHPLLTAVINACYKLSGIFWYTGTVTKTYTVDDKKPSGNTDTDKDKNNPSGKGDTKNHAVQTGDTAAIGLWAVLMAVSAGAAALLKGKKRKEDTEE